MYRTKIGDREWQGTHEELQKAVNRGKIPADTPVWENSGERHKSAAQWLNAADQESDADLERNQRDPKEQLRQQLDFAAAKPPHEYDTKELAALQDYFRQLKSDDSEGLVDWESFIAFRKSLRKIEMAALERELHKRIEGQEHSLLWDSGFTPSPSDPPPQEVVLPVPPPRAPQKPAPKPSPPGPSTPKTQTHGEGKPRYLPPIPPPRENREQTAPGRETRTAPRRPGHLPPIPMPRHEPLPQKEQGKPGETPLSFWHQPVVVILALIVFAPLGLILLWTSPRHSPFGGFGAKLFLSFLVLAMTLYEERNLLNELQTRFLSAPEIRFGARLDAGGVSDERGEYTSGMPIYFSVQGVPCLVDKLLADVDRLEGREAVDVASLSYQGDFEGRYDGEFTPTEAGVYRVRLYCGQDERLQGQVLVAAP